MLAIQEENENDDDMFDFNRLPTPTKRESRPGLFVKRNKSRPLTTPKSKQNSVITTLEMSSLGKDPTPTKAQMQKEEEKKEKAQVLSDKTLIGDITWSDLKHSAMVDKYH